MGFGTNNWDMRMDSMTLITCHTYDTGGNWVPITLTSPTPLNDGQWHHLAIVWDGVNGVRRGYIDGVQRYAGTMPPGTIDVYKRQADKWDWLANKGTTAWDWVKKELLPLWETIKNAAKQVWDAIKDTLIEMCIRDRNNEDKKFDVDNEQSPLNNLLKPNRRIQVWLGISIES